MSSTLRRTATNSQCSVYRGIRRAVSFVLWCCSCGTSTRDAHKQNGVSTDAGHPQKTENDGTRAFARMGR